LYRTYINDEWTDLVEQVYARCKIRWGYRIPRTLGDRAQLRALCQRALAFENHFFSLYRTYLVQELHSSVRGNQLRAAERLGEIIYSASDVAEPLQELAQLRSDDVELTRAAEAALSKMQTSLA
jgi:hypothetical protein